MIIELPVPIEINRITKTLTDKGFLAYIVGGCVRDLLMNRKPRDWDITTNANPKQIEDLFSKTFYENKFGTVTVVNEGIEDKTLVNVEITPFRTESTYSDHRHPDDITFAKTLTEDLTRRDFTINALAYDPHTKTLIDENKGVADIKNHLIKTVGDPNDRFTEDALRLMRAIRLATELNFEIEMKTKEAITPKVETLLTISKERIRDEWNKIVMSDNPLLGLNLLHQTKILDQIIPELEEGIGITQGGSHIYDVWEHSIRALKHSAFREMSLELRLAALFHDIGKPRTRRWSQEKNNWTFYGHEVVGAKMVTKILTRLKYSKQTIETVTALVRYHMFFVDIEKITLSAVRRIIAGVGENLIWDLMKLRTADRIGMGRPKETPYKLRKYESMIEEALRDPTSVKMLKINGEDLMSKLNIPAGPKIGQILNALLEEVLDDPTKNTPDYLHQRALALTELSDLDLTNLAKQGQLKKAKVEKEALTKIRRKHKVD